MAVSPLAVSISLVSTPWLIWLGSGNGAITMPTSGWVNAVIPGTVTVNGVFEVGMHDGVAVALALATPMLISSPSAVSNARRSRLTAYPARVMWMLPKLSLATPESYPLLMTIR